jgi:hypothetical protein
MFHQSFKALAENPVKPIYLTGQVGRQFQESNAIATLTLLRAGHLLPLGDIFL